MMSTRCRHLLALFFCLFLCVFLHPAAHADDVFDELEAAIENQEQFFDMSDKGDVTFTRSVEIPAGFFVNALRTRIIVPANTTLKTSGIVETSGLKLTGGKVEVRSGIFRVNESFERTAGKVEVYSGFNLFPAEDIWPDNKNVIVPKTESAATNLLFKPTDDAEFGSAVQITNALDGNFIADIDIYEPVTLTGQHVLTHKTMLRVSGPNGGSLTMAEGSLLQYQNCGGTVFLNNGNEPDMGAEATVNGAMFLNAIVVEEGCTLATAGGSVIETDVLELGGSVQLNGRIFRVNRQLAHTGGTVEVYGGFNLFPAADVWPDHTDVIVSMVEGAKTSLLFTPTDEESFASAVETANELDDIFVADINLFNPILLTGEHIITHKTDLRVRGDRGGRLYTQAGSLLAANQGGNLFLSGGATAEIGGELNTNGISVGEGCVLTIPQGGVLKANGQLRVPMDARVVVNGQLHILPNGQAVVGGTLENNSFINIQKRNSDDPRLIIEDTGLYFGSGRIGVKDSTGNTDSYFVGLNLDRFERMTDDYGTQYLPLDGGPELFLPAGLTFIDEQAFAGDTFGSVYIPASVTWIDPSAFDGMEGLTVYGRADTAAEDFAEAQGFDFVIYP